MQMFNDYSASYWNILGMPLKRGYAQKGSIRIKNLSELSHSIDHVCFLKDPIKSSKICLYSSSEGVLFLYDYEEDKFSKIYKSSAKWVRLKSLNSELYALGEDKSIEYILFDNKMKNIVRTIKSDFQVAGEIEGKDFVVAPKEVPREKWPMQKDIVRVAYIGPFQNRITILYLDSKQNAQETIKISLPKEYGEMALEQCHMSYDKKNDSIIICNTRANMIFEYSLRSGQSYHICGNYDRIQSNEADNAREAGINMPHDVVVYRPQDYISKRHFSDNTLNLIDSDKTGVKPRYFYFCDTGNNSIKRIADFPNSPKGATQIYSLMGFIADNYSEANEDTLLKYKLDKPKSLSVSVDGSLCFISNNQLYILFPASAVAENVNFKGAEMSGSIYTS